ncbi:MAG: glycerol kinase GlpK [Pirellulaceae bacterium]|nr:glycerol kinase GlpK [Pirellulaceae bacterium]MDG2103083.1 glycerol kinase GlpK [Pirellulaceae bacterium]
MSYILALDEGTTSCRGIVFDLNGQCHGVAQQEFEQIFPQPGWVEHDATEIFAKQAEMAKEAIQKAGIGPSDIAGIGITNQRETVVLWDRRTGKPIYNAIVWQDRRTAEMMKRWSGGGNDQMVRDKTGLLIDTYFCASKLAWLLENIEGARAAAEAGHLAFGTIECWLLWNLTDGKVHATDESNACRTLLYNIHSRQWDEDLLSLFDIPAALLPEVVPCSGEFGTTTTLGGTIPIRGMIGDQQAALFGQACVQPGMAKSTFGTGCFLLLNTGEQPMVSQNNLLTTIAWSTADGICNYALEGSVFMGGATIQWLRDGLGIIKSAVDVNALAASVPDSGGVVLVPAFAGLGAPYWDAWARGSILGMTRGSTSAHIARAALEGIAFTVYDVLQSMKEDSGIALSEVRVDGGAAASDLLMQIQADLLNVEVLRPTLLETTAFGAAGMAALAAGLLAGPESMGEHWNLDRKFEPDMDSDNRERMLKQWQQGISRARCWAGEEGNSDES